MAWLLDTNVLSEIRRQKPHPNVLDFFASHPLIEFFMSVVTLAEIRFGIEMVLDPGKRALLADWLDVQVRPMFAGRVLGMDEAVLLRWRLLVEQGRRVGHTYSQPDLLIAATALQYELTVATRDLSGFSRTGVKLVDPWNYTRG
jgi:hypothetical protein